MNTLDRYGCPYKFAIDFLIKNGIKLDERENGIKYEDSNATKIGGAYKCQSMM